MSTTTRAWIGALALCMLATQAQAAGALPAGEDFGAGITLEQLTPLAEVVSDPERHQGQTLLVMGVVREVCQRKGCWMVVADGESQVRIRFADYGFFVPKDCRGKHAYVEGEVKAWNVPAATPAPTAAGRIHSDMERGFIRAEVISFTDLMEAGNLATARERGTLRTEGKEYRVADGDVITFRFHV